MPRRVAAVISNNGGYFGYRFWQEPHLTEVYKFNHLILGQHIIYKINFIGLSLVFLGVAFTVASSVGPGSDVTENIRPLSPTKSAFGPKALILTWRQSDFCPPRIPATPQCRDVNKSKHTCKYSKMTNLQTFPSHVGLLGNEVADDLAKAATSNTVDPDDHMVLTSTEIYSRAKELICREPG
ncbi:hypothetical protein TNCV_4288861 [Trichonephila clavipes]|nr:hypothetical protein TNCV_4288861 [Trichonephila clavipes]